jgi:hypothetical protein
MEETKRSVAANADGTFPKAKRLPNTTYPKNEVGERIRGMKITVIGLSQTDEIHVFPPERSRRRNTG